MRTWGSLCPDVVETSAVLRAPATRDPFKRSGRLSAYRSVAIAMIALI